MQVAAAQHWGDLPEGSLGRRAWAAMRSAETAFKAASLLNFLVFLRYGRYRRALLSCRAVTRCHGRAEYSTVLICAENFTGSEARSGLRCAAVLPSAYLSHNIPGNHQQAGALCY